MSKYIRNIILVLVVGFLLFYLFTNPQGAADAVRTVIGWGESIIQFFASLAK